MRAWWFLGVVLVVACTTDVQVGKDPNVAPAVTIDAPADGSVFDPGAAIEFVGQASDGNGLDDLLSVRWVSSLDGEIGSDELATVDSSGVSRVSGVLSAGSHAIEFAVTDVSGEEARATIGVTVTAADQEPFAEITAPVNLQAFYVGTEVALEGRVDDGQQDADSLNVQWIVSNAIGPSVVASTVVTPTLGGVASSWSPGAVGTYIVQLAVADDQGNTTTAEVGVQIIDPDGADLDGDTWSIRDGDCDDGDPAIHPEAGETCGNAIDDDCTGAVDDKDDDQDAHIDLGCVNYVGGLPVDDCDDADPYTWPGAPELADGLDNDCDGEIDNGGPGYDDDSDCFCEVGPCVGTAGICPTVTGGDCDDADADVHPGASDDPEPGYVDLNCDGVDGDVADSVFVDPVNGNDGNGGLDPSDPVFGLDTANAIAGATGRGWVLIGDGEVVLAGAFVEGVNLAGGYDPG
ncbi:MAG: putative metal-binding motif-containing protein, partial [Myxococcota bacterium]